MADVAVTKVRVLVVDDDPDQLELVRRTLVPHFEVQTHHSALGVSNLVRSGEPDLVLLDVNIPALQGDQVLSLARRYAPRDTKFILYSAADESQLRSLARASGADGYLSKSIQGPELVEKLTTFLRARGRTGPGDAGSTGNRPAALKASGAGKP